MVSDCVGQSTEANNAAVAAKACVKSGTEKSKADFKTESDGVGKLIFKGSIFSGNCCVTFPDITVTL